MGYEGYDSSVRNDSTYQIEGLQVPQKEETRTGIMMSPDPGSENTTKIAPPVMAQHVPGIGWGLRKFPGMQFQQLGPTKN